MELLKTLLSQKPRLVQIAVRGFRKHFKRKELQLARVNFLLGPNNAGKTSFFEALELASWMSNHYAQGGASQAAVRRELGLDPAALNHDGHTDKAVDFSVEAQVAIGQSFAESKMVADNTDVRSWQMETDDAMINVFPCEGYPEWVYLPLSRDAHSRKTQDGWADDLLLGALAEFGVTIHPWARQRLMPYVGTGESGELNLGFDTDLKIPSDLRGVIGFKNNQYLIRGGQNLFWLVDEKGGRIAKPDWRSFFGLEEDGLTKRDFLTLYTLVAALEKLEARLNFIVEGQCQKLQRGGLSAVLSDAMPSWIHQVLTRGFYEVEGRNLDASEKRGVWKNPFSVDEESREKDLRSADHMSVGTLLAWLRENYSGFPWIHAVSDVDFGTLQLPKVHQDELDMSRCLIGMEEDKNLQAILAEVSKANGKDQMLEWMRQVQALGVDISEDEAVYGPVVTLDMPEISEKEKRQIEQDLQSAIQEEREYEKSIEEAARDAFREEEELRKEVERAIQQELEQGIYWQGQSPGAQELSEYWGGVREPVSKAQSYGISRRPHPASPLGHGTSEMEESDAYVSASAEGQLSQAWGVTSHLMSLPFSFAVLRVRPDVAALKGMYYDAAQFPYEEVWEAFMNERSREGRRRGLRKAMDIMSCCLHYMQISEGIRLQWKPRNQRLELDLQAPGADVGDLSLEDLFRKGPKRGGLADAEHGEGVSVKRVSEWGELGRQYFSQDELHREDRRGGVDRMEMLGRGSRLVLHSLLALFEASLRSRPTLVILEEPSAFLHPSMASKFTDVLRFAAQEFDVQVVVETHNEYMIRQLQTARIKGESLSDVSIHYFDGETGDVTRMNVEESGRIDPPIPEGFLDKSQTMMREQARIQIGQRPGPKGSGNVS